MILNSLSTTNFEYTLLNENILRYTKTFNKVHNFMLLGQSATYVKNDGFSGQLSGFPTDNIEEFNGGVVDPAVSGGAYEDTWHSFFWKS
jgi:hypothetical protein